MNEMARHLRGRLLGDIWVNTPSTETPGEMESSHLRRPKYSRIVDATAAASITHIDIIVRQQS